MTTININDLTIAQLESTPLEGFYIQPMPAKDLLRTVVDFANNRTENYVVEIRFLSDQNEAPHVRICSCKEGECIFPYTYINLYNTHLSSDYILNNLKQLLPQQRWYKKFLFGAWVVQNYK